MDASLHSTLQNSRFSQVNCLNTGGLARPPSVLVGLSVAAGTVLGRAYRLRHPLNAHVSHDTILHNPIRPYLGQLPCRIRGAAVHAPLHGLEPNQAVLTRVLHAPRSRGAARAVSVHLRDVPPLPSTNLLYSPSELGSLHPVNKTPRVCLTTPRALRFEWSWPPREQLARRAARPE